MGAGTGLGDRAVEVMVRGEAVFKRRRVRQGQCAWVIHQGDVIRGYVI